MSHGVLAADDFLFQPLQAIATVIGLQANSFPSPAEGAVIVDYHMAYFRAITIPFQNIALVNDSLFNSRIQGEHQHAVIIFSCSGSVFAQGRHAGIIFSDNPGRCFSFQEIL